MTDLPPLPWGDDFEAWLEVRNEHEVAQAVHEYAKRAVEADRAAREFCHHDDTERLGAIWTRCNQCGKQWADDEHRASD